MPYTIYRYQSCRCRLYVTPLMVLLWHQCITYAFLTVSAYDMPQYKEWDRTLMVNHGKYSACLGMYILIHSDYTLYCYSNMQGEVFIETKLLTEGIRPCIHQIYCDYIAVGWYQILWGSFPVGFQPVVCWFIPKKSIGST